MPEITDSELRTFLRYQNMGTPEEIQRKRDELEQDNKKQRDELSDLRTKLPKDGEVIITKSKADALAKYEKLGKPDEVEQQIQNGQNATAELAKVATRTAAAGFAKAAGLADETVDTLVAIPELKEATFEVKKGKVKNAQGQEVDGDVAYLTLKGDKEKPMTFEEAKAKLPALKGLRMADQSRGGRVNFVDQTARTEGSPGSGDIFKQIREEAAAKQGMKKDDNQPAEIPLTQRLGMTNR